MLLEDECVTELEKDELGAELEETWFEELDEFWFEELEESWFEELDEIGVEELDSETELELIELETASEESWMELDESVADELSVLKSSMKCVRSSGPSEQLTKRPNAAIR